MWAGHQMLDYEMVAALESEIINPESRIGGDQTLNQGIFASIKLIKNLHFSTCFQYTYRNNKSTTFQFTILGEGNCTCEWYSEIGLKTSGEDVCQYENTCYKLDEYDEDNIGFSRNFCLNATGYSICSTSKNGNSFPDISMTYNFFRALSISK